MDLSSLFTKNDMITKALRKISKVKCPRENISKRQVFGKASKAW